VLLFRDDDERFEVGVEKSASGEFLIIGSYSIETSEEMVIPLPRTGGAAAHREAAQSRKVLVRPREHGLRYESEHHGRYLYAVTNADGAHNSKVCVIGEVDEASGSATMYSQWIDVRHYNENVEITDIIPFQSHIVVLGRQNGLLAIWRCEAAGGDSSKMSDVWVDVAFEDEVYNVYSLHNHEFDAACIRLRYSSPVTPPQVMEVDLASGARTVLKETEVPGYNKALYVCRRVFAPSSPSASGEVVQIPISMVYKRNDSPTALIAGRSGAFDRPVLMSGYGAYGICKDPGYDFSMLPLLDRGVVFAIAHVRGGGEMGRHNWYEKGGKYLTKMNTFLDFADCAKYLISQGVTDSSKLAIVGRSAGGLLIGAVINMFPSLFKAAVADVPFVDV
jgi:oligopeptidase B